MVSFNTRFAPSPTGPLHCGHVYAARVAHHFAKHSGGKFTLRIDDIDHTRCRDQFTKGIFDDLNWLGLKWDGAVPFQTQRLSYYQAALKTLQMQNLVYPCFLSRKELADMLTAPHSQATPSSIRDTDKLLSHNERQRRAQRYCSRLRLRMKLHNKLPSRNSLGMTTLQAPIASPQKFLAMP